MNIFVRADASIYIGSGHVMRCLVLATELREKGHFVTFICRPQLGDLIDFIESKGFQVIKLKRIETTQAPTFEADYLGWLMCPVASDAKEFCLAAKNADWVITDHYAIGRQWQEIVREYLSCKILSIDDLVREHDADLILDQTLGRNRVEYQNCNRVLAGSQYALLKPKFSQLRERIQEKVRPKTIAKVLVSMGGIDNPNATLSVIRALSAKKNVLLTVLLSPNAPHYNSVKEYCIEFEHINHIDFVEDMASLMFDHAIAIGAPGSTSWERACLGIPSIVVPLAENQVNICNQLTDRNICIKVKVEEIASNIYSALELLIRDWTMFHSSNLEVCDGKGVFRVVKEIESI